ncbi:hypothetical protein TNCV_2273831 [Trichonephila clavipes]|nr:hypothetical protein TNCV_2273831 [Trichonephila clavipes]
MIKKSQIRIAVQRHSIPRYNGNLELKKRDIHLNVTKAIPWLPVASASNYYMCTNGSTCIPELKAELLKIIANSNSFRGSVLLNDFHIHLRLSNFPE